MAKATMVFFSLVLMLAYAAVDAKRQEWYCKLDKDNYQICHKNIDGIPDPPSRCKCENMKFQKADDSCKYF